LTALIGLSGQVCPPSAITALQQSWYSSDNHPSSVMSDSPSGWWWGWWGGWWGWWWWSV